MKKLLPLFALLCLPFFGMGQELQLNPETQHYQAQGVLQIDSSSSEANFLKVKEWVALNYVSAQDVIQFENKESGKIICKGIFPTTIYGISGGISHTLILEVKPGKVRYTFTDFRYRSQSGLETPFERKVIASKKKLFQTAIEKSNNSASSIKNHLQSNKTDW